MVKMHFKNHEKNKTLKHQYKNVSIKSEEELRIIES